MARGKREFGREDRGRRKKGEKKRGERKYHRYYGGSKERIIN